MINLKNLKSIFVVEDENAQKDNEKAKNEAVVVDTKETKIVQEVLPPPPVAPIQPSNKAPIDKRFVDKLMQAIEKNNQEGFDYLEFRSSLKALASLPLDEATRFRSAFAAASTMGLTVEKLLQTAQFYKGILDKEKEQFNAELNTRGVDSIRTRSEERSKIETMVKDKETQIETLKQQIAQNQQEIIKLSQELEETSAKINEATTGFAVAYEDIVSKIIGDTEKIKKYLQ